MTKVVGCEYFLLVLSLKDRGCLEKEHDWESENPEALEPNWANGDEKEVILSVSAIMGFTHSNIHLSLNFPASSSSPVTSPIYTPRPKNIIVKYIFVS